VTITWRELLAEAEASLTDAGVAGPALEARRLVEEVSGLDGADYVVGLDDPASRLGVARMDRLVARRVAGEPLQYVLGSWGFRGLDLLVDPRVLIPRPETEVVVTAAIDVLDRQREVHRAAGREERQRVVDLGTGSGAIALALAAERDTVEVWATDVSPAALEVATANLAGLGRPAARVHLAPGSWFEAVPAELAGRVDLVVSNPPYVAERDELPAEVAVWEPSGALIAGPTGREALEHLIAAAPQWLDAEGALVLELAPNQSAVLVAAAREAGFDRVELRADLAGRDRVLVAWALRR
jgi:release factor glutamine methyltransferase